MESNLSPGLQPLSWATPSKGGVSGASTLPTVLGTVAQTGPLEAETTGFTSLCGQHCALRHTDTQRHRHTDTEAQRHRNTDTHAYTQRHT